VSQFWELFKQSIIIQGFLTVAFTSATLYLWVLGEVVPPELLHAMWLILGFWFGTKLQHAATVNASKERR